MIVDGWQLSLRDGDGSSGQDVVAELVSGPVKERARITADGCFFVTPSEWMVPLSVIRAMIDAHDRKATDVERQALNK